MALSSGGKTGHNSDPLTKYIMGPNIWSFIRPEVPSFSNKCEDMTELSDIFEQKFTPPTCRHGRTIGSKIDLGDPSHKQRERDKNTSWGALLRRMDQYSENISVFT